MYGKVKGMDGHIRTCQFFFISIKTLWGVNLKGQIGRMISKKTKLEVKVVWCTHKFILSYFRKTHNFLFKLLYVYGVTMGFVPPYRHFSGNILVINDFYIFLFFALFGVVKYSKLLRRLYSRCQIVKSRM